MTDDALGYAMSDAEIASLLNSKGHGVLSMGNADRGYGIPMSYGYDETEHRLVVEFVSLGDGKKRRFLESSTEVTFTVYEWESLEAWESVVVTGTVRPLEDSDVSERFAALLFSQAEGVAGDLRWIDSDEIDREWFEIVPEEITGMRGEKLPGEVP
ncbi:pyridoxamine 5'-phosphate oxidase family protein [Natronobeatus ordinarius]|uniref:pyridoxamine 5'-phosphate oxidase family protein n=1 Tax=Natronobeatus ordinarius TaxID=2963433 RepID=UPI0020CBDC33|nr:pyridoxamine 5'-phosphate oxidase family protein [Natronobeatus ordinarius]